MKWRHWAILIILVLLNYIIFSTALTQLAEQRRPGPDPTRTPRPTFENIESNPVAWLVLPTSTAHPTRAPMLPTTTEAVPVATPTATASPTLTATPTAADPTPTATPSATNTPIPPTATPTKEAVVHTVASGETLSQIAARYGVTIQAIMAANSLTNPDRIYVGQVLVIPSPAQSPPIATAQPDSPKPTNTPRPKAPTQTATPRPPTATPTRAVSKLQFTAELVWDPLVAPNCAGPSISNRSIIRDTNGSPVNGVRVEVNCYNNLWLSRPSGTPGEYESGHYGFALGQLSPVDWTCTARVVEFNGQPVATSEAVKIHFDTNDCTTGGNGHQAAILNWTKHW